MLHASLKLVAACLRPINGSRPPGGPQTKSETAKTPVRNFSPGRLLWAAGLLISLATTTARAVTPADADLAFDALNQGYWDANTKYFRKEETGPTQADFWLEAQLWDTVMDQYDRTRRESVKQQINEVYEGFIAQYPDWTTNKYNDDIMWWTLGCTRAYRITTDERYLKKAKASFDFVYNNFCDDTLGGGIWWTSDRRSKNSCVESPAVIAAVRLSELLNDSSYLDKARSLYEWQKKMLTDGNGKVFDNIRSGRNRATNSSATAIANANANTNNDVNGRANERRNLRRNNGPATFSLTYNQGTYIGASVLLYLKTKNESYLEQAKKTADWTRANLCTGSNQILRSEGQGDGGAFKGILVRYMKLLIEDGGCKEYLPWMRANADMAWRNRRASDNIMGYDWSVPTGSHIQSQTAGSAVAVVLCFSAEAKKEN